ncbi:hypothetical protein N9L89_04385, partial [Gammaproteobacteria bacterium]|nr:hypothetical protein [Gammaproteobacteria bacterium]
MKQEALTVNLMTSILCFEMALRHWMFYLPLEQISTEMGVNQPNLGVWLIPVTASLGMFYYFGRNPPDLSFYQIIRICFIGMIPMVIAFIRGGFENIFAYTIYDPTSRPSFLILLPIALSVLVSQLSNHRIRILILLICVVIL